MDVAEVLKIALSAAGAVTGSIALGWRIRDELSSYLRISLSVDQPTDNWITIQTTVDNRSSQKKALSYAILLIGQTDRGLGETISILTEAADHKLPVNAINDLEHFVVKSTVASGDSVIIPLTFYYEENVDIADETLSCKAALNVGEFKKDLSYDVRFFVFSPGRLHRSTHSAFVLEEPTRTG